MKRNSIRVWLVQIISIDKLKWLQSARESKFNQSFCHCFYLTSFFFSLAFALFAMTIEWWWNFYTTVSWCFLKLYSSLSLFYKVEKWWCFRKMFNNLQVSQRKTFHFFNYDWLEFTFEMLPIKVHDIFYQKKVPNRCRMFFKWPANFRWHHFNWNQLNPVLMKQFSIGNLFMVLLEHKKVCLKWN